MKLQVSDQKRAVSDPNLKASDSKLEGAVPQPVSLAGVSWVFFLWSGRPRGHGTAFQKADRKNEPQQKTTGLQSGAQFFAPQLSGTT